MSYAHEIPNFTRLKIRQKSWQHPDSFWYMDKNGVWRNQKYRPVDAFIHELFTRDDWEVVEVVTVWDWVLAGIEIANPKNRVAKIVQGLTAEDAPELGYKLLGTERTMTPAAYAKHKDKTVVDLSDWAGTGVHPVTGTWSR